MGNKIKILLLLVFVFVLANGTPVGAQSRGCNISFYLDYGITDNPDDVCDNFTGKTKGFFDMQARVTYYDVANYDNGGVAQNKFFDNENAGPYRNDDDAGTLDKKITVKSQNDGRVVVIKRPNHFTDQQSAIDNWEETKYFWYDGRLTMTVGSCVLALDGSLAQGPDFPKYHRLAPYTDAEGYRRYTVVNEHSDAAHPDANDLADFLTEAGRQILPLLPASCGYSASGGGNEPNVAANTPQKDELSFAGCVRSCTTRAVELYCSTDMNIPARDCAEEKRNTRDQCLENECEPLAPPLVCDSQSSEGVNFVDPELDSLLLSEEERARLFGREPEIPQPITPAQDLTDGKERYIIILDVEGDVEVLLPGETEWRTLEPDMVLPEGTRIATGLDSSALILIRDVGVAKMMSFSEMDVTRENVAGCGYDGSESPLQFDFKLKMGEVEFRVDPSIPLYGTPNRARFSTPVVDGSVRGTHFWVSYDETRLRTTVGVYEGKVMVRNRETNGSAVVTPADNGRPGVAIVELTSGASGAKSAVGSDETPFSKTGIILIILVVTAGGAVAYWQRGRIAALIRNQRNI